MERMVSALGIFVLLGIAWSISYNRKAIRLKPVVVGLALQFLFAVLVWHVPLVRDGFYKFAQGAEGLIRLSDEGAEFLFGCLVRGEAPVEAPTRQADSTQQGKKEAAPVIGSAKLNGILFVRMLPPIIFFSALTSVLYYLGVLQLVVKAMAFVMTRFMGVSGAESLSAASNTVLGMTEAPLLIKPHVAHLTPSELLAVMMGGFATSAGGMLALYMTLGVPAQYLLAASLMSAPAALAVAKIILPETGTPRTAGSVKILEEKRDSNVIEALASGTTLGLRLALNVAAMLISFLAMIALINVLLGFAWSGLTLQKILGWMFAPFAFFLGVPPSEVLKVGQLLGTKIGLNEFIAYKMLAQMELSPRALAIASFALCGFSNFGSIGIQIGGLGGIAPQRRGEIARFGLRAMVGGALSSMLTAAIAGILL